MSFSTPEAPRSRLIADHPPKPAEGNKDSWPAAIAVVLLFTLPFGGLYLGWMGALMLTNYAAVARIALAVLVISACAGLTAVETTKTWSYSTKTLVRALSLTCLAIPIGTCFIWQLF